MIKFIGTAQKDNEVILFYLQEEEGNTFLKAINSTNGFSFEDSERAQYIFAFNTQQEEEQNFDWNSFRIAKEHYEYLISYKSTREKPAMLLGALSKDLSVWHEVGDLKNISETAAVVPEYQHKEQYAMYTGEKDVHLAYSTDLTTWSVESTPVLTPRADYFDATELEVANAYVLGDKILLLYYVKNKEHEHTSYLVGAAYFEKDNPSKLIWRSEEPVFEYPIDLLNDRVMPLGTAVLKNEIILYWKVGDNSLFSVNCPIPEVNEIPRKSIFSFLIKKAQKNPIISPRPDVAWESRATFNTAAIYEGGKVHFLYRALGDTDLSVLGYATSTDGINIDERSAMPAYIPREPFETPGNFAFSSLAEHFVSGGGYGGVEDPRITRVEDKIYLTYVAFDGATPPRAASSRIDVDDFLKNKWDKWETPKLISAPGMVNKSAVIMPEKINGKYVVMHRVYPNILIDYLDDLEFDSYLQGHHFIPPRKRFWDSKKVGAGAPPMRTKDGWLLIYQSVGYQDPGRYKIGAMMLDINNPSKVLYRTHTPIIAPDEEYENNGFKAGVVYPCGSVIMNNNLNIYYGGADSVVCAASADLDKFLFEMKRNQAPKLTKVTSPMFNQI